MINNLDLLDLLLVASCFQGVTIPWYLWALGVVASVSNHFSLEKRLGVLITALGQLRGVAHKAPLTRPSETRAEIIEECIKTLGGRYGAAATKDLRSLIENKQ